MYYIIQYIFEGIIKVDNFDGIKGLIYYFILKYIGLIVCEKEVEKEYQIFFNYQLFKDCLIMQVKKLISFFN